MTIDYKIEFHSYWHCGSGLAAGADADALVVKDKDGLPFVPGKTIKGLLREAATELLCLKDKTVNKELCVEDDFFKVFGSEGTSDCKVAVSETFFSNAELPEDQKEKITRGGLSEYMYDSVSRTALKDGVADEHSLRKVQVAVPCTLYGKVLFVPEGMEKTLEDAMGFVKALGLNRSRGLGRCTFTIVETQNKEDE